MSFSDKILKWYASHKRELPWRNTKDPYKIWLSEIILQQTRVNQGLPYYERFVDHFPTVNDLANASEQKVLQLWQGLGYYSRGRNLHASAQYITHELDGVFPTTYKSILALKGVGEYTAAAIASFAYGEQIAVLDGNVIRVLTRYFGIEEDISTPKTIKMLRQLANEQLPNHHTDDYNQGIMEFGALQCAPKSPDCNNCPLQEGCEAFSQNKVATIPVKLKKTKVRQRYFNYVVITSGENVWIKQRMEKDVWHKLYDFPLIETDALLHLDELLEEARDYLHKKDIQHVEVSEDVTHILSHQRINARFFHIELNQDAMVKKDGVFEVNKYDLGDYGKPILIENYLNKYIF